LTLSKIIIINFGKHHLCAIVCRLFAGVVHATVELAEKALRARGFAEEWAELADNNSREWKQKKKKNGMAREVKGWHQQMRYWHFAFPKMFGTEAEFM
jgi:hypothetical protein